MNRLNVLLMAGCWLCAMSLRAWAEENTPGSDERQAASGVVQPESPPVPLEFQPYRVRVSVAFEPDPSLTRQFESQVKERMAVRFAQTFGLTCELDPRNIEAAGWFLPHSAHGLERLSEKDGRRHVGDADVDKLFVVLIRSSGNRFVLGCREWDAAEQSLGPVFRHETWERRDVADAAIALLGRVFRPVYSVENVDPLRKIAQLKVRAGGLPMGDPDKALVRPGDVLQPLFRYLNREQAVQRIQTVPWTILIVDRVDGSAATCSIVSGMRGGLGTNRRRRVEAVAVRVHPAHPGTRVQLVLQSNRAKPLAGHQVLITRRAPEKMNDPAEPARAITDRDGTLLLARDDQLPLAWLAVRSGEILLARVPFVPGVTPNAVLELPDDALRLSVERDLNLLKGRIIATVAQRATISSRALAMARSGDAANARKVFSETEQLPKIADFETQLTAVRIPALESAQKKRDRVAESRVTKLCTRTSDLIPSYLAEDKLRIVQEEIKQLSETDKKGDSKGAPGGAK